MVEGYDRVLRQLDATIYIVHTSGDPLTGRVELVSGGTFRLLGYRPEQFVDDPGLWHRIMHPDDVQQVIVQTQEVFRLREPRDRMYRLRHAVSGAYHWIEDSTVPFYDEQGTLAGIAGVARNISALKKTERDLELRKSELERLIDAMPDGVLVADHAGRILEVNAGVERLMGWHPKELIGQAVEMLLPEGLRKKHTNLRSGYSAAPQIRRMGTYDLVALHRDGKEVPVDIMLGPLPGDGEDRVLVLIRDMTEARLGQQGLAFLSSIVSSSDDSIVGCDLDGAIVSWNCGAEQLFGYTEAEAIGKHMMLLYPHERRDECLENLRKASYRERPSRYESERVRKNGSLFDVSVIVSPIEDRQGRLLGMSAICRDITERKRADAAFRVAKRVAEAASQAKSEFLANMSHELRTPLNGVIGLTDVVLDSDLSAEQRENLLLVKASAESLLTVLSDILDISKLQSGRLVLQRKQFRLRDLVERTMKEFEIAARKKQLRLSWHVEPGVPTLFWGDPDCLYQIISNLAGNAVKFTAAGEVALTVATTGHDPGLLSFRMRDTGVGVPGDQQRSIFEVFLQVDNSLRRKFGGTGLGLAICAALVDLVGGRIWVESDGHSGSTFEFTALLEPEGAGPDIAG